MPAFLDHYRALGVDRFFVVDNDSTDGSTEYLVAQSDVHVFRTTGRFGEAQGGTVWFNALLKEFGAGVWCVTVDIDELPLYPGSDRTVLRTFTRYLDRNGYEAVACLLLDLYPSGPLRHTVDPDWDSSPTLLYFDPYPYSMTRVDMCPGRLIRGGVRERVFYPEIGRRGLVARMRDAALYQLTRVPMIGRAGWIRRRQPSTSPCLTKVPLVRWDETSHYLYCNHWISPKIVAPESGVLLHFKLLGDFHEKAASEAARGQYYDNASEYRRYTRILDANPNLTLTFEDSVRFEGPNQLVRLGLMRDTEAWAGVRGDRPAAE